MSQFYYANTFFSSSFLIVGFHAFLSLDSKLNISCRTKQAIQRRPLWFK